MGQNAVEEIDFQPAADGGGEDYGWNIVEGDRCYLDEDCDQTDLTPPVFTYDHEQPNCGGSVTGGYVFRGDPASPLYGVYIFGEFCLRQIWALYPPTTYEAIAGDVAQDWTGGPLLDVGFNVMSFGEDEAGNLYVMGTDNGVYRIVALNQDIYLPSVRRP